MIPYCPGGPMSCQSAPGAQVSKWSVRPCSLHFRSSHCMVTW
ncbi:unnamed protein product, partial [Staurois parvus]